MLPQPSTTGRAHQLPGGARGSGHLLVRDDDHCIRLLTRVSTIPPAHRHRQGGIGVAPCPTRPLRVNRTMMLTPGPEFAATGLR